MRFHEQLCKYMELAGTNTATLAKVSMIPPSQISRYRNGKRKPKAGSDQLVKLAAALEEISAQNGNPLSGVLNGLSDTFDNEYSEAMFSQNLDRLMRALGIHNSQLAKGLNFDASYISKIRHGVRCPSHKDVFVSKLSAYLLKTQQSSSSASTLPHLLGCTTETASTPDGLFSALSLYLYDNIPAQHTETYDFFKLLDSFSLNSYIRSIRFEESNAFPSKALPSAPQSYYGKNGLKEAELVFEQAALLSESKVPIFMYSDMPMEPLADGLFPKQWMMGLAMILRKGIPIQIIHHLNRPLHEMMLGLAAWIPLYMTGQVQPFYLDSSGDTPFRHMLYVSGNAALSGECIAGRDRHGKKYVTFDQKEIGYYRKTADHLLQLSHPLMEIYRLENANSFQNFLKKMRTHMASRHNRLCSLSFGTLPMELLEEILSNSKLDNVQKEMVKEYAKKEKKSYESILREHEITEIIPLLDEDSYPNTPLFLPTEALFADWRIPCSYAHYAAHLAAARDFAKTHGNFHLIETNRLDFLNIQIQTVCGEYSLVSKSDAPTIHFVIRHPQLVDAIENMTAPVLG